MLLPLAHAGLRSLSGPRCAGGASSVRWFRVRGPVAAPRALSSAGDGATSPPAGPADAPPPAAGRSHSEAGRDTTTRLYRPDSDRDRSKAKRKVAMHVGYVGSEFRGLQRSYDPRQADLPLPQIETVLADALLAAGGVTAQNAENLSKVGWSRSSRTDKGVHSLSTVVSLKLLVAPDRFDDDPEGLSVAAEINEHLPGAVRVFSVQRTNKGFSARTSCLRREYLYVLPARLLLPGGGAGSGAEELGAAVGRLRDALKSMEGWHPFHNYTKRSLYRKGTLLSRRGARTLVRERGARNGPSAAVTDRNDNDDDVDEEGDGDEGKSDGPGEEADGSDAEEGGARSDSGEGGSPGRKRRYELRWIDEMEEGDVVGDAHFRKVEATSVDDPAPLREGGEPAVRIRIRGQSFMLHQIRHMVGASVAAARGDVPGELVEASLKIRTRVTLPRAPPHTLVLCGSEFGHFRLNRQKGDGGGEGSPPAEDNSAKIRELSGERLELREGGAAARADFEAGALASALEGLLVHEDWGAFEEKLSEFRGRRGEYEEWLEEHPRESWDPTKEGDGEGAGKGARRA